MLTHSTLTCIASEPQSHESLNHPCTYFSGVYQVLGTMLGTEDMTTSKTVPAFTDVGVP